MVDEQLYTMAGTKIFISENPVPAKTKVTAADFASVTWIETKGLFSVGELGADQAINEYEPITSDYTAKSKGIKNGGTMSNVYIPMHLDPGQTKLREAVNDNCRPYAIKVERGADCSPESEVAISVANPGVVTWTGSNFAAGQPVMFSTTDTLPVGLTPGTIYYVVAAGLTADEFSVADTVDGTPIETTGAGTGTHTATAPPAGMTDLFQAFVTEGARSGGDRSANYTRTYNKAVNGAIITV